MPTVPASTPQAKLRGWRKSPGEAIAQGEIVAEVESEAGTISIEAEVSGVLREIRIRAGGAVATGEVLAHVELDEGAGVAPRGEQDGPREARGRGGRVRVAPLARTRAAELGVDTDQVVGSGPGGRILRADVEEAYRNQSPSSKPAKGKASKVVSVRRTRESIAQPSAVSGPGTGRVQRSPVGGMTAAIARRMAESNRDVPQFSASMVVQMDEAVRARAILEQELEQSPGLSVDHLVLKACADALVAVPEMNSRFAGDALEILSAVNLGMAVAMSQGFVVPVLPRADEKGLLELAREAQELTKKARGRTCSREELSGATFTVSNLGMYEVESFQAVVFPPQAGILAVGALAERPVARNGEVVVAHTMSLTVSCDHRAVDGVVASRFLAAVRGYLEQPAKDIVAGARG